jgi:HAD superfamily phosphoserine phosphatase-like hydrolase
MRAKGPSASLFDLDHTLLKVNSSFAFGMHLYRQRAFGLACMLQLGSCYLCHKLGICSMAALHGAVFKRLFLGQPHHYFQQQVEFFLVKNLAQMLYPPAIKRLVAAQEDGHYVAILSNSPAFLVKAIALRLGVTVVEASAYGVDSSGCFSHIEHLVYGESKAAWVQLLAQQYAIDRQNISIYSDSILDLPFLQAGGMAIGVSPDRKLRALCQRYRWEII